MLTTDIQIELHIPDFNKAKDFYGFLGFEVVWERTPSEVKTGYLVMRKGNSIFNFFGGNELVYEHEYFSQFPKSTHPGFGVELVLPVDDINDVFEKLKRKDPAIVVKDIDHDHSHCDFRIVDPFGYYIRIVERYDWVNGRDKDGNNIGTDN